MSIIVVVAAAFIVSCGSSRPNYSTGELVGAPLISWSEPAPYGMIQIPQGSITLGEKEADSLWGTPASFRTITVDAFWMDRTEITNAQYRQFVNYVRDSIMRERLADPMYGGNPIYKITTDKYGDPITPQLDWSQPLPSPKRALQEELDAMNSVYYTNPITGVRSLDATQMLYKYEEYDYHGAALHQKTLNKIRRGIELNDDERVTISKDSAYLDDQGRIVEQTIIRPITSEYDFLNTYIVPIYPDEASWVRDFPNSLNEKYMRLYFNHPGYDNHPVVGVSWEQAMAFCAWRSETFRKGLNLPDNSMAERFRLPSEAEWEYASRAANSVRKYPWNQSDLESDESCFLANFKPFEGDYSADGHVITAEVSSFSPNDFGLFDMAGNVSEWTTSSFFMSSYKHINDINSELFYMADDKDPKVLKRKVVRGGSWKDVQKFIRSTTRSYEYQDVARSYIGFRCVRNIVNYKPTRR